MPCYTFSYLGVAALGSAGGLCVQGVLDEKDLKPIKN